jgi:3-dehydroquinate dehydratase-2
MEDNQACVLVIHGPNLNMLGMREPEIYGATTLEEINENLVRLGEALGFSVKTFQSNHEGAIVEKLQEAMGRVAGIIINPAAFTHTSVAVRDALLLHKAPVIEVHLSNIFKREPFRHHSYVSDVASAVLCGFGHKGYEMALTALAEMNTRQTK